MVVVVPAGVPEGEYVVTFGVRVVGEGAGEREH